ncbi:MAG: CopG family antitoxin [Spirulina sp.]
MQSDENTKINKSSISQATSYEEIGEFWDEHGLDEYWEHTYPVEFEFELRPNTGNKVYYGLDMKLSQQLLSLAKKRDMSHEELLNLWVREKLQEERVSEQ